MNQARTFALSLALSGAIASFGAALNTLIKGIQEQNHLNKELANQPCRMFYGIPCSNVSIDIHDIIVPALIVISSICLIALSSLLFLLLPIFSAKYATTNRQYEAPLLALLSLLLIGSLIPLTTTFASNAADITVHIGEFQLPPDIGEFQLPPDIVDFLVKILGEVTEYKHIGYLKPFIIVPWISWLFTTVAAVVLFIDRAGKVRGGLGGKSRNVVRRQSLPLNGETTASMFEGPNAVSLTRF